MQTPNPGTGFWRMQGWLMALLAAFAVVGCGKAPGTAVPTEARAALSARAQDSRVSPAGHRDIYRRSVDLYSRKRFRDARATIDSLLRLPDIPAGERGFLERQRAICAAAEVSGKPRTGGENPRGPSRTTAADCGPRALRILLERMGKRADLAMLTRHSGTNRIGTTLAGLERAAKAEGLRAEAVQMDLAAFKRMSGTGIAWVDGEHYVAVWRVEGEEAVIRDPNQTRDERIATEELLRRSGGIVLTLAAK